MMMNLFSMFDPSTLMWKKPWYMLTIPIFLVVKAQTQKTSKSNLMNKIGLNFVNKEIDQMMEKYKMKNSDSLMKMVMATIMILNLAALMPYNFTSTAHLNVSLGLGLTIWISIMMNSLLNNLSNTIMHLTPMGTPPSLMNFMVIIETVSSLIRPITLSIRLSANMVAGHLLMSLLSSFSMQSSFNLMASYPLMVMLIMLESAVSMIQSYVMMTLLTLYHNETF